MMFCVGGDVLARDASRPVVARIDESATSSGIRRADERAEHDHQDDDRQRDRDQPGLARDRP